MIYHVKVKPEERDEFENILKSMGFDEHSEFKPDSDYTPTGWLIFDDYSPFKKACMSIGSKFFYWGYGCAWEMPPEYSFDEWKMNLDKLIYN